MRLFGAALLGLLSLLMLGCSSDQGTGESQVSVEPESSESSEVAADSSDNAEQAPAATEAPTETPTEAPVEPTEVSTDEPAEDEDEAATVGDGLFPTVVGATASTSDGTSWNVSVTLSSEYDTQDRYADAWRVLDAGDNELGIRVLGHDHANEQPFTRSTSVDIPEDIDVVYIEGRDQVNGWNGERFELVLTR